MFNEKIILFLHGFFNKSVKLVEIKTFFVFLAVATLLSFPIFLRNSFWTKIKSAKTLYQCYN